MQLKDFHAGDWLTVVPSPGLFPDCCGEPWCLATWHSSTILAIKRLGRVMAWHTGEEEGITTTWLFQRLSVCLMCGNA